MATFIMKGMNSKHTVRRYKDELTEAIEFFERLNVAEPSQVPELRLHVRRIKILMKDFEECLLDHTQNIKDRVERERRYKAEEKERG